MKVSELHPSKYIKSDDLRGKAHLVVISHLGMEEIAQNERKPVLYFQNKPKGMVLNITNSKRLAMFLGDETDNWTGKEVVVYPELTQDRTGKPVWGIRVRPPENHGQVAAQAPQPAPAMVQPAQFNGSDDMNDEVPF